MIVDCTMFHWEFDVLELRMKELWDAVDVFYVTESVCDHRGNTRALVLSNNLGRFSWAKSKLVANVSEKSATAVQTWDHEKYQRQRSVYDAVNSLGLTDNDFIIISDVDEIPRAQAISELAGVGGRFTLHMPMYYYYLNLYVHEWYHPKALSVQYLTDPNEIRTGGMDRDFDVVFNSGWHFSYLGTPEQIQYKLKTFAHDEFDSQQYTDPAIIQKRISERSDLFGRFDGQFSIVDVRNLPQYVQDNPEKYKHFILER